MRDAVLGYVIMAAFYGGLLAWLFVLVHKNVHPSRSLLISYIGTLAVMILFVGAAVALMMLLAGATGNTHKPSQIIVGAGVGAVLGAIVVGWQVCKSRISRPRYLSRETEGGQGA